MVKKEEEENESEREIQEEGYLLCRVRQTDRPSRLLHLEVADEEE